MLPFSVRGDEEHAYLREGMVDLLAAGLQTGEEIRSVDPRALLAFVRDAGDGEPDVELAQRAAARFGAGWYVLGSVVRAGEALHLEASLFDARNAAPMERAQTVGPAADLLRLVEELTRSLLERLGLASALVAGSLGTGSLEAMKAFLSGEQHRRNRLTEAFERYRKATVLDPEFALGQARIGVRGVFMFSTEPAVWQAIANSRKRAVELAAGLPDRERKFLLAMSAEWQNRGPKPTSSHGSAI